MKRLGKIKVLGMSVSVIVARPEEVDVLSGEIVGYFETKTNRIVLHREHVSRPGQLRFLLAHELLHALIEASGASNMLQSRFRLTGQEINDLEEELVNALTPAFAGAADDFVKIAGSK